MVFPALDQIITQMMDGANSTRPVPATEEIMRGLPREVLEAGSMSTVVPTVSNILFKLIAIHV